MVKRPKIFEKLDSTFKKKLESMYGGRAAKKNKKSLPSPSPKSKKSKKKSVIPLTLPPPLPPPPLPPPPLPKIKIDSVKDKSSAAVSPVLPTILKNSEISCLHGIENVINDYTKNILTLHTKKNETIDKIHLDLYKKFYEFNLILIQNQIDAIKKKPIFCKSKIYKSWIFKGLTFLLGGTIGYFIHFMSVNYFF